MPIAETNEKDGAWLVETPTEPVAKSGRSATLEDAKARIARNLTSNWTSFIFGIAVTFFIAPLLVHRLGQIEYGIWTLVGDVVGYSWILGLGVGLAVTRYGSRYFALGDKAKFDSLVTTSLVINLVSSGLLLAGGVWAAYVFPQFFSIPPRFVFAARCSLILVAVGAATSFPGSTFTGCLASASRYDWIAIRTIISAALRAALLWFILERGYGLVTVALVSTGVNLVAIFIEAAFVWHQFPWLEVRRKYFDRSLLKPLIEFSWYGFVLSVASRLVYMTDTLVIGFVLGPGPVTFYAIGAKLPLMLRDSLGNITNLYFPFASQMHALGREASLRRLFLAGARVASLYVLPGVAGLAMLGPIFLDHWMGTGFGHWSGPVLIILACEAVFFGASASAGYVLYGMGRHNINAWISLANAGANFVLSAILIRWLGAVGVAWGTLIPAIVAQGILLPLFTSRILSVSVWRFYSNAFLRPAVPLIPMVAWFWFCRVHSLLGSYLLILGSTVIGLMLYASIAWRVAVDDEERLQFRRWLSLRIGSMFSE